MDKLASLIDIAQNIYSRWVFHRLLCGMVAIATLTIITSIMISAMLICSFYATYQVLLNSGFIPHIAAFTVAGIIAIVAILFLLIIFTFLRRLRYVPRSLLQEKTSNVFCIGSIIESFLNGLLSKK